MIALYMIWVFVMFGWCNSLKIAVREVYENNKTANKFIAKIFCCIVGAILDIVEIAIAVWFLYIVGKVG